MICDRCQQPIRPGEGRKEIAVDSASGARPTVHMHSKPCKPVPHQSAPLGPIRH